ncbi:putative DEAD/DEAH box DNA helicase (Mer3) [Aspergillus foveolatus]|uniref:putative DEAD/DEAH box DNA helicase (Mer3) n=1 Tax=Aspergillus foveolatus TaxID=210207 RepID=UPI003CCD4C8E
MRRKVEEAFSVPCQATGLYGKRKADGPGKWKPQSHSNGMMDEKLIQGSQVSPFFSTIHGQPEEKQSYQPLPSAQISVSPTLRKEDFEDDIELSAFETNNQDLELLAQSDRKVNNYGSQPPLVSNTGYYSYQPRDAQPTKIVSPYFSDSQVTPHQSIASRLSNIGTRDASSPLARTGGTDGISRNRDSEMHKMTEIFHPQSTERDVQHFRSSTNPAASHDLTKSFRDVPTSDRGIVLLSVRELPDNYRPLFNFPVFNAVQSKCFHTVYKSDDNVVIAAPTGSGKTVVMELAICRLLNIRKDQKFKVVYQAPTKSLCSERFRDWNQKFHALGLQCAELTGDTDHSQLGNVQNSQIIVTTPEKWDSMTRKWKDHIRLMQPVKLFLIDEVHTLKEARGATLEAVVSRMKSIGSNVRFVASSATIPNSEDIATWLGRNATSQHVPAHREHFGEEFRPVKLQKFVYGYHFSGNNFAFDKLLNSKLSNVIGMHSTKKPIMIFCSTRNSTVSTAKELARLWSMSSHLVRMWKGPNKPLPVKHADLKVTTAAGVAFHHAGLEPEDRHLVENGYLQGKINDGCGQEYSDLEVMQMLGRAGRPQFDDSATAVILTRKERVSHYERLVSGSESLESSLHLNLIEHLNAEIGLGNIKSTESAASWLAGTFLFVRLRRNPTYYRLKEGANRNDTNEMLRHICEKDIKLLQEYGLVDTKSLKATPFGDAMSRYSIRYETMKTLIKMKPKSDIAQILAIICQAEEFRDIRFKAGEKLLYKEINRSKDICFPVEVDIVQPAHKISLLIQFELGAVEFPSGERFQKHRCTFQQEKNIVFAHVNRVIRCIIDCQVYLEDSVTLRNALELSRSLAARVWDHSPLQMKQVEKINAAAVRKLVAHGIDSIVALEKSKPHLINIALSKNQAFGMSLQKPLADFPKLRVSVKMTGKDIQPGPSVGVNFKAEIAFMNEKCPTFFQGRPVYVCFVAETSDGRLIDFRRTNATELQRNYEIPLSAELKHQDESITCHVMCDEIGQDVHDGEGLRNTNSTEKESAGKNNLGRLNTDELLFGEWLNSGLLDDWDDKDVDSKMQEQTNATIPQKMVRSNSEEKLIADWGDLAVEFEPCVLVSAAPLQKKASKNKDEKQNVKIGHCEIPMTSFNVRAKQSRCKHLCCREGLSSPPKVTRKKSDDSHSEAAESSQSRLTGNVTKKGTKPRVTKIAKQPCKDSLGLLSSTQALIQQLQRSKVTGEKNPTPAPAIVDFTSSDYGDEDFDDLPSPSQLLLGIDIFPKNRDSQDRNPQNGLNDTSAVQDTFELGDSWVNGNISSLQSPLVQPRAEENHCAKAFLIDLVSPEPEGMFSVLPRLDGCDGQKRKFTDKGAAYHNNRNNKRVKS